MNIVIPAAGDGSRFREAGYSSHPKPLIEASGKMLLQWAVESVGVEGKYIFLVRRDWDYPWADIVSKFVDNFEIIYVDEKTEGAACTVMLAEHLIDNSEPLIIANSDQYIEWDRDLFFDSINLAEADGGVLGFESCHPKWSYAKIENALITEVAEKRPISDFATCGLYYFKQGRFFCFGARQMIAQDKRFKGEFYVCPVYNELISGGLKILPFHVKRMYGLGTPEDVEAFVSRPHLK